MAPYKIETRLENVLFLHENKILRAHLKCLAVFSFSVIGKLKREKNLIKTAVDFAFLVDT